MIAYEVVIDLPPIEMLGELGDIMSGTPGAASELGNALANGEVGALDKGRVDSARQASSLEAGLIFVRGTPNVALLDLDGVMSALVLDDLRIEEIGERQPDRLQAIDEFDPLTEVGREGVEVVAEAIGAEDGDAAGFEAGFEFMHNSVGHILIARTKQEDGHDFGFGVKDGPDPDIVFGALDVTPELVELEMGELEVDEEKVVELATVIAASGEPGADGGFTDVEDFRECGRVIAIGKQGEDLADYDRIGFQAIKRGMTSGRELGLAGLTAEILNGPVIAGVLAITGNGMDGWIGNAEVGAGGVRAEETVGGDRLFRTAYAFDLIPGNDGGMWALCERGSVAKKSSAAGGALIGVAGMHNSGLARSFVSGFFIGEEVLEPFLFWQAEQIEG